MGVRTDRFKVVEYRLVREGTLSEMAKAVEALSEKGWRILGAPVADGPLSPSGQPNGGWYQVLAAIKWPAGPVGEWDSDYA